MKDGLCTVYAEGESFKAGEKVIALYRSASVREAADEVREHRAAARQY